MDNPARTADRNFAFSDGQYLAHFTEWRTRAPWIIAIGAKNSFDLYLAVSHWFATLWRIDFSVRRIRGNRL